MVLAIVARSPVGSPQLLVVFYIMYCAQVQGDDGKADAQATLLAHTCENEHELSALSCDWHHVMLSLLQWHNHHHSCPRDTAVASASCGFGIVEELKHLGWVVHS